MILFLAYIKQANSVFRYLLLFYLFKGYTNNTFLSPFLSIVIPLVTYYEYFLLFLLRNLDGIVHLHFDCLMGEISFKYITFLVIDNGNSTNQMNRILIEK